MYQIMVLNGPNLDLLGTREPEIYGDKSLEDLQVNLTALAQELSGKESPLQLKFVQSNAEDELMEALLQAAKNRAWVIFNPGAYTHYSYALADRIAALNLSVVEVHLSNIKGREAFRAHSVIEPHAKACFMGGGFESYRKALRFVVKALEISTIERNQTTACAIENKRPGGLDADGEPRGLGRKASIAQRIRKLQGAFDPAPRLERIRAFLLQEGLDALLWRNTADIQWALGFDGVFDDEQAHALFVSADECILHTDSRYASACLRAADKVSGTQISIDDRPVSHARFAFDAIVGPVEAKAQSSCTVRLMLENSLSTAELLSFAKEFSGASLHGLEPLVFTQVSSQRLQDGSAGQLSQGKPPIHPSQDGEGIQVSQGSAAVQLELHVKKPCGVVLRQKKDEAELERMRLAQAITDAAFEHICDFIAPGQTEKEIQKELEAALFELGAEALAFGSIVAAGAHAADAHAIATDQVIQPQDIIVMDFGAQVLGYKSDMTRTVFVGQPKDHWRRAWECLVQVQQTACERVKAKASGQVIAQEVEAGLAGGGFANMMGHGLGHGVGLDIHELPVLSLRKDFTLQEAEVVTVEPGIYAPGDFGMRLEDFGVVRTDGFEVFTQSTHDIVIIEG